MSKILILFLLLIFCSKLAYSDDFFDDEEVIEAPKSPPKTAIRDPLENLNRAFFFWQFNILDRYLIRPVAKTYETTIPGFARSAISNSLDNLNQANNFSNSVLMLDFNNAMDSIFYLLFNAQIGLFTLQNNAAAFGIRPLDRSFGVVLRHWGVDDNTYFVSPIGTPGGTIVDGVSFFQNIIYNPYSVLKINHGSLIFYRFALGIIDARSQNGKFIDESYANSFDFYATVRDFFYTRIEHDKKIARQKTIYNPVFYKDFISTSQLDYILN